MKHLHSCHFPVMVWLTDIRVRCLSWEARGMAIELLWHWWITGFLPGTLTGLAVALGIRTKAQEEALQKAVAALFVEEDGQYHPVLLREERAEALEFYQKRVRNLKRGDRLPDVGSQIVPDVGPRCRETKTQKKSPDPTCTCTNTNTDTSTSGRGGEGEPDWPELLRVWNSVLAPGLRAPQIRAWTKPRKTAFLARLRDFPNFWAEVQEEAPRVGEWARGSSWLSLDWLLSPKNLPKFLEGNYREKEPTSDAANEIVRGILEKTEENFA